MGWFTYGNNLLFPRMGAVTLDHTAVVDAGHDVALGFHAAGIKTHHDFGTAASAGMLCEKDEAGPRTLTGGTEPKPCCQGNAPREVWPNTAQIEHDSAETTTLQKEICRPQRLIQCAPRG